MNLFTIAEQSLNRTGEKTLLHFQSGPWTNARLLSEAERLARVLRAKGLRPGDHVFLLLANGPEVFLSFLALARMGCVGVPAGLKLTVRELSDMALDSESKWILSAGDLMKKAGRCKSAVDLNVVDVKDILTGSDRGSPLPDDGGGRPEDLAYIIYTSGTTGESKGVMLTHHNIMTEGRGVAGAFTVPGEEPTDLTQLLVLPLSHSYGLMVMGMTYFMGNRTVVLPRYETEAVLQAIRRHEVKLMWAVPTMYALMLAHPEAREHLKSVIHWDSGGAPLPFAHLKAIEERFGGTVTDGYGCTEASSCVTTQSRKQYSPPGSQGFLIKGARMDVVDETGRPVPDGEPGEFLISGDTVMRGYWKKPRMTERVLKDGAYLSGDVGIRHPDGYYVFWKEKMT